MGIELRRFDIVKDGIAEQRELFSTCFPETNGTWSAGAGYHSWKFLSADSLEFDSPSYEYGAWIDGELVGYYGVIPVQYKIGESVCTAGLVCDVMTDPNQQGKGIFTSLGKYATDDLKQQGIDFTTGYPIRPEVLPGHLRVGWRVAFELPIYASPVGTSSILKNKGLPSWLGAPFSWLFNAVSRCLNPRLLRDYVAEVCPVGFLYTTEAIEYITECQSSHTNTLLRTENFLRWRLNAEDRCYDIIVVRRNDRIEGLAIVSATSYHSINVLAILDVLLVSETTDAGRVLGLKCREICKQRNLDAAVLMASSATFKSSGLAKALFIKLPVRFKLIIKCLSDAATWEQLLAPQNWHITWLDTDNL